MRIWKLLSLSLCLLCQSFACQQQSTQPPITVDAIPKPLWSIPRAGGGIANGYFPQFIYKNTLIAYKEHQSYAVIVALNPNTGQELWSWSDLFTQHEASTEEVHVYENILLWRYTGRVYAINLENGQTIWKQRINTSIGFRVDDIAAFGNRFLVDTWHPTYFSGFTKTGNITMGPTLTTNGRTNHGTSRTFLNNLPNLISQAAINDTLAVLPYGNETATFFTIYNLTQNKEIYTKTIPGDTSGVFSRAPLIHNGRILFPAGAFVLCFDLKTGNEIWRRPFSSVLYPSGLTIVGNKIFCNNNNGSSYALDLETGRILWQTRTRGGCSTPFYLNGVVYFTSVANGKLYGLDAENGKILMEIDDPRGGIGFQDVVTGVGDKIFAATYTTLYCFKAAR